MEITFNTPKEITIRERQSSVVDKIEILQLVDMPTNKIVVAITREVGRITLWEGDAYDTIGQWTDQDVINRINELYV
jgi:hypothetical protein